MHICIVGLGYGGLDGCLHGGHGLSLVCLWSVSGLSLVEVVYRMVLQALCHMSSWLSDRYSDESVSVRIVLRRESTSDRDRSANLSHGAGDVMGTDP